MSMTYDVILGHETVYEPILSNRRYTMGHLFRSKPNSLLLIWTQPSPRVNHAFDRHQTIDKSWRGKFYLMHVTWAVSKVTAPLVGRGDGTGTRCREQDGTLYSRYRDTIRRTGLSFCWYRDTIRTRRSYSRYRDTRQRLQSMIWRRHEAKCARNSSLTNKQVSARVSTRIARTEARRGLHAHAWLDTYCTDTCSSCRVIKWRHTCLFCLLYRITHNRYSVQIKWKQWTKQQTKMENTTYTLECASCVLNT